MGEKPIQELEGGTNCGIGKKNVVVNIGKSSLANGSNSVVKHQGGLQNDIVVMLFDGQR